MAPYADTSMVLFVYAIWIIATLFVLRKLRPELTADITVGTGWLVFDLSLNRTRYIIRAIPFGISFQIDEYPAWALISAALCGTLVTVCMVGALVAFIVSAVPHSSPIGLIEPSSAWLSHVGVQFSSPAVIIAVDGHPVRSRDSLSVLLKNSNAAHQIVVASSDGSEIASADNVATSDLASLISGIHLSPYIEVLSASGAAARAGLEPGDLIFAANGEHVATAARLVAIFKSSTAVKIHGVNKQFQLYDVVVQKKQRPWFRFDFGLTVVTPPPKGALSVRPESTRSIIRNEIEAFGKYWKNLRIGTEAMYKPAISGGENILLASITAQAALVAPIICVSMLFARSTIFCLLIPLTLLIRPGYRWWVIPALIVVFFLSRSNYRQWIPAVWIAFAVWMLWSAGEAGAWTMVLQIADAKNIPLEWIV